MTPMKRWRIVAGNRLTGEQEKSVVVRDRAQQWAPSIGRAQGKLLEGGGAASWRPFLGGNPHKITGHVSLAL